jgi:hypothetical protein
VEAWKNQLPDDVATGVVEVAREVGPPEWQLEAGYEGVRPRDRGEPEHECE